MQLFFLLFLLLKRKWMLFLFPSYFLVFEISTVGGRGVAAGGVCSLMSACRSVCAGKRFCVNTSECLHLWSAAWKLWKLICVCLWDFWMPFLHTVLNSFLLWERGNRTFHFPTVCSSLTGFPVFSGNRSTPHSCLPLPLYLQVGFFFCSLFSLFTLHVLVKEVQRNQC